MRICNFSICRNSLTIHKRPQQLKAKRIERKQRKIWRFTDLLNHWRKDTLPFRPFDAIWVAPHHVYQYLYYFRKFLRGDTARTHTRFTTHTSKNKRLESKCLHAIQLSSLHWRVSFPLSSFITALRVLMCRNNKVNKVFTDESSCCCKCLNCRAQD